VKPSYDLNGIYKNFPAYLWVEDEETRTYLKTVWKGEEHIEIYVAGGHTHLHAVVTAARLEHACFRLSRSRPDKDPSETIRRLLQTSRELVADPHRELTPIRIMEIRRPNGVDFELDEPSIERLRALHGATWIPPRVHISDEVRNAFQALHGDIHTHLVAVMTGGIDTTYLTRLGGVEIVNERGSVVWPARGDSP